MSHHFAQLDENNIVIYVTPIADENCCDDEDCLSEDCGIEYCVNFYGENTNWKLTTVGIASTDGVIIPDGFRGNFASIGMTYMSNVATLGVASTDIFIPQQPYPSWSISTSIPVWIPPIPEPVLSNDDGEKYYEWNESVYQADTNDPKINGWVLMTIDVEENGDVDDETEDTGPSEETEGPEPPWPT